ncbi:MAG: phytanoyl-CoA dioxygenase family protein, partial [Fimbriimonadaceae bacterium]|nr:phytanoyl-CoA dioxygenase family protein [Fimbriimonadaceae bacterium]
PTPDEVPWEVATSCLPGDVLWMRPLVFHASGRAATGSHRRVIHLEYSAAELPPGIEWMWG